MPFSGDDESAVVQFIHECMQYLNILKFPLRHFPVESLCAHMYSIALILTMNF